MAPSVLGHYESLLISNASTINTVESSIRSLTWFLPGRFKDAELASEALSATLNLLSLYHDTILSRRLKADPKYRPMIPPSPHSRYTHAWADKSSVYKWAARMLEIVKFLQLFFEMAMRRRFKAKQKTIWRGIIGVEMVKAFLRLLILKVTRRPVLSPPIPEREIDPATLADLTPSPSTSTSSLPPKYSPTDSPPPHFKNNKHNTTFPPTASSGPNPLLAAASLHNKPQQPQPFGAAAATSSPIEDYLLPKALSTLDVKPPLTLVRPLNTFRDWVSEIIYLLRPLIYVIALSRAQNKKTSSPLVVSLFLELVAHYLRRTPPPSFTLERSEYARRDRDLLWYFLRGVVWKDFTQPKIQTFVKATEKVPLINVVGALVHDWMPLIDEYYYYTAT
ncbi:Peroxisomal membrane protein pex16 [Tulasnella sp. UAMH 9824]|nr:Peroxisomal membrane protein pex16 [Tulasnella sp. UAMH 9824]